MTLPALIKSSLLVGAGGFAGTLARYWITLVLQKHSLSTPFGTLIANTAGCLIIGAVYHTVPIGRIMPEHFKLFLTIGFCGGLTTMSSFIQQASTLPKDTSAVHASAYFILTLAACFLAFYTGMTASRLLFSK